jgi:hypothetical protein
MQELGSERCVNFKVSFLHGFRANFVTTLGHARIQLKETNLKADRESSTTLHVRSFSKECVRV